jgi:hypothetical protein
MKARGQITKMGPVEGSDSMLQVEISTTTQQFAGGRDHPIGIKTIVMAERAALKDFSIGDFFEITIEVKKP